MKKKDKQPSPEANPNNQVPPLPGPARAGTKPLHSPALPVLLGLKSTFPPCLTPHPSKQGERTALELLETWLSGTQVPQPNPQSGQAYPGKQGEAATMHS